MHSDGGLQVHFCRGKSVRLRGPYTTSTGISAEWRELVQTYIAQLAPERPSPLLFPATQELTLSARMPTLLRAVRVADLSLNLRAMRRGSLQALAASGEVPLQEVMLRAGHTNERTTRRYLDWGRMDGEARRAGARHAGVLLPSGAGAWAPARRRRMTH